MPNTDVQLTLRLPPGLHEKLSGQAKMDRRSLNTMIVWLLERALDSPEPGSWIANQKEKA
jgi:predicted HicB family RNase H-like nuclease